MAARALRLGLGGAIAFLLLSFYLLPNTILYSLSPWAHFEATRTGTLDRFQIVASVVLCAVALMGVLWLGRKPDSSRVLVGALLVYACALGLGSVASVGNVGMANDCLSILLALATGAVAARLLPGKAHRVALIVLLATLQGVWALWLRRQGLNVVQSGDLVRGGGTFDNPNHLFTLSAVALPMAIAMGNGSKGGWRFALLSLAVTITFAALVCTWSRGGFVAAAIGSFVVAWRATQSNRKALLPSAVALAVFAAFPFYVRNSGTTNAASTARSNAGRAYLAGRALDSWKRNPILGSGIGSVQIDVDWPSDLADRRPKTESLTDPRSVPLLWLMEMGFPGGLLFVALLVGAGSLARRSQTPAEIAVAGGIAALLASGVADVTFGSVDHSPGNVLIGFLIASGALARFEAPESSSRAEDPYIQDGYVEDQNGSPSTLPIGLEGRSS